MTIHPRFEGCSPEDGSPRLREVIRKGFLQADEKYWNCQQGNWLPHDLRFNGIVVIEGSGDTTHAHILQVNDSFDEQMLRSTFLLEYADNVVKTRKDPRDDHWQRTTREFIEQHPWRGRNHWIRPQQSIFSQIAPRATVMVQKNFTPDDVCKWAGYMTKMWKFSPASLSQRRAVSVGKEDLDWFELRELFPPAPRKRATPVKMMRTGGQVLDFDDFAWRLPGKGKLK